MAFPGKFETATRLYTRLPEVLGEGGAGYVFKVASDDEVFALKLLKPDFAKHTKEKRFRNELKFLRDFSHPNIVPVLDDGISEVGGRRSPFFVMPFFPSTLRRLMNPGLEPLGKREPDRALLLFDHLLSGVEAAHLKGVVHRDVKPENVLHDEANDRLVLTDFGIARFSEELLLTAVNTGDHDRLASFRYAAPEQKVPGATVDHRADLYALGLILCELFTGVVPEGTKHTTIASVIPEFAYLDELVELLRPQRSEDRLQSVDAVKKWLFARKNEFVILQRVSELSGRVVPTAAPDDEFAEDPVRLVGVEVVPGRELTLTLNRPVNIKWLHTLQNAGLTYANGHPPSAFRFEGNKVSAPLPYESHIQHVIDLFKGWLEQMPRLYRQRVEGETRKATDQQKAELERARRFEEERLRLNRLIRI